MNDCHLGSLRTTAFWRVLRLEFEPFGIALSGQLSHSYHACCACRESVVPQGTGSVMNGQMIDYALAGNFTKLPTGQSPRQMQKRTDVMAIHRRRRVHSGSTLLWQCFKCVFVMIKFGSARSLMR